MFLQKRSESMMGIESMISSTQWAPRCPFRKWHGWILCWTPSFSSLGLLEYKFCSNQCWFVRSLQNSLHCLSIRDGFLFSEMSLSVHFWNGLHQCPVFRIVSHSCSALPGSTLVPDAWKVIFENRLLLLLLPSPMTLQRDLGGLGVASH